MATAYVHQGMAVNWLAKHYRLLQDRVEVLEKAARKNDSHEPHYCERKTLSLCEALGVKEWQWNTEADPYMTLAPGTWDYTAKSELEDSLVEVMRLYKEEFGRDIDEEEEKGCECEAVAQVVDIPVHMVAKEEDEHVPSVSMQDRYHDNADDSRGYHDNASEDLFGGPALWVPSGKDVFARGFALHEELQHEATMVVQKWWRRWQRERELTILRDRVNEPTSSVLNGRRDYKIPETTGIENRVWSKYGLKDAAQNATQEMNERILREYLSDLAIDLIDPQFWTKMFWFREHADLQMPEEVQELLQQLRGCMEKVPQAWIVLKGLSKKDFEESMNEAAPEFKPMLIGYLTSQRRLQQQHDLPEEEAG